MTKRSRLYTRGGDRGETSLIGGKRVAKSHPRIEAYGSVDELMAHTSMLRDMVEDQQIRKDLLAILDMQMASASMLAAGENIPPHLPSVGEEQVLFLEKRIDEMDAALEPLQSFVIPGGHPAISQAHVARTVCRRAERSIVKLGQEVHIQEDVIRFYNRLSDYFFVLSRTISSRLGVIQKPWKSML
jgi:cob(I)alamin adenosyltransferase